MLYFVGKYIWKNLLTYLTYIITSVLQIFCVPRYLKRNNKTPNPI